MFAKSSEVTAENRIAELEAFIDELEYRLDYGDTNFPLSTSNT